MTKKEAKKTKQIKVWINLVTVLALAALIIAARQKIVDTFSNLFHVRVWVLLFMIPLQALNYHSYTKMYQELLIILDEKVHYKKMYKVALELNFINNVFPSGGVSGISYYGIRMKKLGVNGAKSTLVQVMKFALIFISFQILLFIGLMSLAIAGKTNNLTILVATSLSTILLFGTFGLSFIIGSKERINAFMGFATRIVNRLIHVVRPKYPETINLHKAKELFDDLHDNYLILKKRWKELEKPLYYALLANATEVLTIYTVYVAFGSYVNIGAVIIAYAVANFAGLVSVLPGGVGIYEFLTVTVAVAAGIPPEIAAPVTLMYRILNMLIQLPPGYYFYQKALHSTSEKGL